MNRIAKRRTTLGTLLAAALLAGGCGSTQGSGSSEPPLAGARIGGPFTLTDQDGRTVRDTDFAGKYRLVYFGYTFCPDVCPTDMQHVGQGLRLLEKSDPALAAKVVPVFITVDPARDTPAVLKQFVTAFHPRMVGLTGTQAAIDAAAKAYGVAHEAQPRAPGADGYLVDHSRVTYLMSPDGKPLALVRADTSGEAVAEDLRRWVK
ncbi:MAG: SCO family protein [Pseudomonadota bacterium]